jgi:hypothetical protein
LIGSTALGMTFHACFGYLALGGLGSCYSFDREREVDHRHEKIFSTTARSQAERDPKLRQELVDAVQRPNVRQV